MTMKCLVALAVLALAAAQGPMNGIAKSTYAASADGALKGMNFLLRLFNNTASLDGATANVDECAAGTSDQSEAWYETEGRSSLAVTDMTYGTCWIKYGVLSEKSVNGGKTAVVPPTTLGGDCSTSNFTDLQQEDDGHAYVVLSNNAYTCCKACASDSACTGAVFVSSESDTVELSASVPANPGKGFGFHLVSLPGHSTDGAKTVEEVEAIFTSKMGDMSRFDWFMDYNIGLFTGSLDEYVKRLELSGARYLAASWPHSSGMGYSVFFQVSHTQMIIELMGLNSRLLRGRTIPVEQRMTDTRLEQVIASPPEGLYLSAVSVSRAISAEKLEALEDFYTTGAGATVTMSGDANGVSTRCYEWTGAGADVCFRSRSESTTTAEFTPRDFEDMMASTQAVWLTNPACNMMRWEDNHYAFDSQLNFDGLLDYVEEKGLYYVCGMPGQGAHYVYDPSGWGVQLDVNMTKSMPGCTPSGPPPSGGGDDSSSSFCSGGTCSASITV